MSTTLLQDRYHHRTSQVRSQIRAKDRQNVVAAICAQCIGFALVTIVVFTLSTLVGNSLSEQSRREAITARERTRSAQNDLTIQRQRLDEGQRLASVERWALDRGFLPPDQIVAMNNAAHEVTP